MDRLIVDTTAVYGDWHLEKGPAAVLLERAREGELELIFPEVVIEEMVGHVRRDLDEALDQHRRAAHRVARLTREDVPRAEVDVAQAVAEYEQTLRAMLADAGATIAPIPDADHGELVKRAVARTKPFSAEGSGYRDALIWETVREEAAKGPVFFVSNNVDDFYDADKRDLASDLLADLEADGVAGNVSLYRQLRQYIRDHVPPPEQEFALFSLALSDAAFLDEVKDVVGGAVETMTLSMLRGGFYGMEEVWLHTWQVLEIDPVEGYEVVDDELIASIRARVEVELEFTISYADLVAAVENGEDVSTTDVSWDPDEFWATASATRQYWLDIDVTFKSAPRTLEVIDVLDATAISDEAAVDAAGD